VVLGGGKEYAAVEAMRASVSRARSGANVPRSGLRIFFLKPILSIGWEQPIRKIIYFLYPKNSIDWADRYEK
jgi:hypothetical protein